MTPDEIKKACESIIKPLESKLDNLLSTIALKSDLDKLFSKLESKFKSQLLDQENAFIKQLEERDKVILTLQDEIHDLSATKSQIIDKLITFTDKFAKIEDDIRKFDAQPPLVSLSAPEGSNNDEAETKEVIDHVILGDSLIRHLKPDKMFEGKSLLSCHPGADVEKIRSEYHKLSEIYDIKRLILNAGSNNTPRDLPIQVSNELLKLVNEIKYKSPHTQIYVNAIPPKVGPSFFPGINYINQRLCDTSVLMGFKFIEHPQLACQGQLAYGMYAPREKVKIHLSFKGVAIMADNIRRRVCGEG